MQLTPDSRKALFEALQDSFSPESLAVMVYGALGESLDSIMTSGTIRWRVRELIMWCEKHDRVDELLTGARRQNSTNRALQAVVIAYQPAATAPDTAASRDFAEPTTGTVTSFLDRLEVSTDPRTLKLVELLTSLVHNRTIIDSVLTFSGLLPGNYSNQEARITWTEAVRDAAKEGRLRVLFEAVATEVPELVTQWHEIEAEYQQKRQALEPWYPIPPDVFTSMFVGAGAVLRPMVNRDGFRSGLSDLIRNQYRTMVVTGPPRSGKTYALSFIDFAVNNCDIEEVNRPVVTHVSTHNWTGTPITALEIVTALADRLGISLDLALDGQVSAAGEQADVQARKLIDRFVGRYPKLDGTRRWIVLDGLDRPGVRDSARDFAHRLIGAVEVGALGNTTQLIVLGFGDELDGTVRKTIRPEEFEHIELEHVEAFVSKVAEQIGTEIGAEEAVRIVAEIAAEGLNGDLSELEDAVSRVVPEHFAPTRDLGS